MGSCLQKVKYSVAKFVLDPKGTQLLKILQR